MDIRDLSIGDWVRNPTTGSNYKITATFLTPMGEMLTAQVGGEGYETRCFSENIEPIPLTPEILEKNGFVDNGKGQHYLKCGNGITVRVGRSPLFHDGCWLVVTDKEVGETITTTCVLFNAKHIHEIQRAMRLGNVGKEMEL